MGDARSLDHGLHGISDRSNMSTAEDPAMVKAAEEKTAAAQDLPTPARAQRTPSPVAKPSVKASPPAPLKSQQYPAVEDQSV